MIRTFSPSPDLRAFIQSIYILESPWTGIDQYVPAWTKPIIVFQYSDPVYSSINGDLDRVVDISVNGMVTKRYRFSTTARHVKLCVVEFTPVGMYTMLREHADAFTDASVDAYDIIPARRRAHVCEALYETDDDERKITLIERFLRTLVPASELREVEIARRAVQVMRGAGYGIPVSRLADAIDIGERHLRRAFSRVTGLTPKVYQRIRRFRNTFLSLGDSHQGSNAPTGMTLDAYYDQAHMTNEFKAFTGFAPRSLPFEQFAFYHEIIRDDA